MRILVLGGSGFIGSAFCEFAAKQGDEVFCYDIAKPLAENRNVHYIQGDFFDLDALKEHAEHADIIVHAMSTMNPGNSQQRYLFGYEKELAQTVKLCGIAQQLHKRMIFLSSGGTVYGEQERFPIKEPAGLRPINHYANLKVCIENSMRIMREQTGADFIIARIANPYGKGQDYRKGTGFIDAVIQKARKRERIEIWGNGCIERDYVYIEDVCGMLYELCRYQGKESVFNISTGVGTSQNQIIAYVEQELQCRLEVRYLEKRSFDVKRSILDNSRIRQIYEAKPISVNEGIHRYLDSFGKEKDGYYSQ